jgi:putative MATE family efflux protein
VTISLQKFKKMLSGIDMTQGKPWKNLLLFTLPLLIGNIFQQMYSTADAIILGRFVGDNALAAVGSSMPMFFLLMVVMMGISMGTGIMVSQYFGAKKRNDLSHTVGAALTLITILGVFMMALGPFVTRPLLVLLDTPAEILDDSVLYMTVLMVGILGMAYFNILSGILRGMGDAFSPLLYLAVTSILNVFLNLILIPDPWSWTLLGISMPGFGFGVWGAAVGTVFAQGLTSLLCLRRLRKMRDTFDMGVKYLRPKKEYTVQLLKLGIPTAASQAIFAIAMMIVQPLANYFGPTFLAVNIIVMRIDGFVMMPNFSFGNAITVYAGQNMGAGKVDRLSVGVKQCILMALGTAVVLVSVVLFFGHYIAGLFTQTEEVIVMAMRMLRILAIGYIIFGVNMVLWGAMRGAGDAITPMWAAVINTVVVRVPTAYLFVHLMGRPEALFFSLLAGWTTNALLGVLAYRFGKWRTKGLVTQNTEVTS